ncbi:hypothetical protein [Mycolicibacterium peregrinum]|nr:hypothetical protein [Mycolicibacterium peregrinum]
MSNLFDDLAPARHGVAVSPTIEAFLSGLQVSNDVVDGNDAHSGTAQGTVNTKLLGFFTVDLARFGPNIGYRWKALPGGGFQLDLLLDDLPGIKNALTLVDPNTVLVAARRETEPDPEGGQPREWLTKTGDPVDLHADLCLRVHGTPTAAATITWLKFELGQDPQDDVFVLKPTPTQILFGDSGFGIDITDGIVVDDSTTASAPGSPSPEWTGLAIRNAKLYIPRDIPLIGGHAIDFDLRLGTPGGLAASVEATIPAAGTRPQIDVRMQWQDPAASSLVDLLPTAIEATAKFGVAGRDEAAPGPGGGAFTLAGGDPLTVRVRCSRALQPAAAVAFEVSVDAAGPDGLVKATGTDAGGKAVVTAAALATALIADSELGAKKPPSGDESGIWLHELLTAAGAASAFFDSAGKVVIDRASVALSTAGAGQAMRLSVDYLVDVKVSTFSIGNAMRIAMADNRPMRIRYRNVAVETTGQDLASIHLSFANATLDVEDPGAWIVQTPGSLLDILGTRSGHGSLWYEIDLKFNADLGPITVSDATVRITADGNGHVDLQLRGLGVDIDTAALTGHGAANITDDGFSADISAQIGAPLGVGARVIFVYKGGTSFLLDVTGSLPGAIPLGPTGLGLYSLGGMFGLNMRPVLPAGGDDIVERQLQWTPNDTVPDAGAMMLGLQAGVGTLYDLAFTFSATGKLIVTVPDPSFRLAVNARVLHTPDFLNTQNSPLKGLIVIDEDGITVGARGNFVIDSDPPQLVEVKIPLDARLPFADPSSWYFRLGSDGMPGRPPGPMTAKVLPKLFDIGASAYLMVQGDTIDKLGGTSITLPGPAIGFGFAVSLNWGVPPVWLQLSARAAVGMATNPWFLAGSGTIGGALHLGPFSIGAHADLALQLGPGDFLAADFRVCGSIDLWFTEIEGCVDLHIGPDKPSAAVPPPAPWRPLRMSLSDRHYVEVGQGAAGADDAPTVWPDVVPILQFDLGPNLANLNTAFAGVDSLHASGQTGNDKLRYTHYLNSVELWRVDGVPALLTTGLEAAWQQPKQAEVGAGGTGNPCGARELALLTHRSDMWAHRRSDGAANTAPGVDPVTATASACRVPHSAMPGWALGDLAQPSPTGWTLPAAPEPGTHISRFTAAVTLNPWGRGLPLSEAGMASLIPAQFTFRPGSVVPVDPITIEGRSFEAALGLPMIRSYQPLGDSLKALGLEEPISLTVVADTSLREAELWVILDGTFPELVDQIAIVDIDSGADWLFTNAADLPDGRLRVGYTAPTTTRGARLRYPLLQGITVLGLHGTSWDAFKDAKAAAKSATDAANTVDQHNNAPPQFRTPLKLDPDALYLVRVVTQTAGQTEQGAAQQPPVPPTLFPEEVQEYFFRTAKLPPPGAVVVHHPPVAELAWREFAWEQAVFKTDYLARYLKSYSPGDRTQWWYLDDDLVANFDVDHVDQLAGLYGYRLDLACQRTDGPPRSDTHPAPWLVVLNPAVWQDLTDTDILDSLGQRYLAIDTAHSCPVPKSGASLKASTDDLQPLATYQLNIGFVGNHVDGQADPPPADPLPGIIFSTSRYRNPDDQLADLGFRSPPGAPHGYLSLTPAVLPEPQISDAALAAALTALGMEGWPLPTSGRTSLLWTSNTRNLAGVLVESPEPLARQGRLDVTSFQVNGVNFGGRYGDSSQCRYLFTPPAPLVIAPSQPVTLTLAYTDAGTVKTATCTTTSPAAGEVLL